MNETTPKEIERKYLIRMPDITALSSKKGYSADRIEQTYLLDPTATTRVRRRERGDTVSYTRTSKRRISARACYEDEQVLTEAEYLALLDARDTALSPVKKTRHVFCENGLTYEIDVYPFWREAAILEVELEDEGQTPPIPDCISVIAEVTEDRRFKNRAMAEKIPDITSFLRKN